MSIRKFENFDNKQDEVNDDYSQSTSEYLTDIRVKDIVSFLQKFDPETKVYLDKDGWRAYDSTTKDQVISMLFDDSSAKRGNGYIMVNN